MRWHQRADLQQPALQARHGAVGRLPQESRSHAELQESCRHKRKAKLSYVDECLDEEGYATVEKHSYKAMHVNIAKNAITIVDEDCNAWFARTKGEKFADFTFLFANVSDVA